MRLLTRRLSRRQLLYGLPALALPALRWPPSVRAKPKRSAAWWLPYLGWVDVRRRYGTDRAAIERASREAGEGATLYFDAGTYRVDGDLRVEQAGQRWVLSREALIERAAGTAEGESWAVIRVRAPGVTIEGEGTIDAGGTALACLLAERAADLTAQDLALVNSRGTAAVAYSDSWGASDRARFRRLRITACASGIAWIWGAATGGTAEDNNLALDGLDQNGITANQGVTGLTITRNAISGAGRFGIELWGGCHDAEVLDNTILGPCQIGVSLAGSWNGALAENVVTGASYAGLELAAADGALAERNDLTGCALGLMVDATTGAALYQNTIRDSQRAVMALNAAEIDIEMNTLDGWSGGHAPSAVYLQNSRGIEVVGNDLSHGPGACIAVDGSHDAAVTGNTYHDLDGPFWVWTWGETSGVTIADNVPA